MKNLLIAATSIAGAVLPWLLPREPRVDSVALAMLTLLALVAGLRCIKAAGGHTWFVPTDAFVLAAIVTVGGRAACLVALAGLMGALLGVAGRLAPSRLIFNTGAVLLATVAAAAGHRSFQGRALPFVAAALCYFAVNTTLVAAVVALDRGGGWLSTWRRTFLPTMPRFALAAVLGGALCGLAVWGPSWMLVLGLLPAVSGTLAETLTSPRSA